VGTYQSGRLETARRWLEQLDDAGIPEQQPAIAIMGAWMEFAAGYPATAERWAALAEQGSNSGAMPDGSATMEPWLATLRAQMCRHGIDQARIDAGATAENRGVRSSIGVSQPDASPRNAGLFG
jgi:LuxR family transcriptional regulator, maltose regulon positive regulatory protein